MKAQASGAGSNPAARIILLKKDWQDGLERLARCCLRLQRLVLRGADDFGLFKKRLACRAHDVWTGATARKTADMRGVDIPRLSAFNMVD